MIFQCLNQRTYVISGFCGHLAATMWRNSLYKLLSSSNRYARSSLLSPSRSSSQVTEKGFEGSSVIQLYSSLSPRSPLSVDSSKLGFALQKVSRIGISSSPAVIDVPLLARDAADAISHYGQCYWELSKARLSMLVVATSGAGYILGGGQAIDFAGLCWTCTGTMMVAASANSLNQVFEVNNDALMKRTSQRPLPSGRLSVAHAITFASSVGLAGTAILACKTNTLAAGLAASNLLLYAFVYTPLKQIHPVNTWVGAVVGAIPPLLGWAAASGEITLNGMVLPAALYFWQIPHFMALAYLCRNDYAAGGFKMFSLTDASGRRTALVALRNCLYLIPLGYVAYDWGLTSGWFCLESSLLTLGISTTALLFYRERTTKNAKRMFLASLLYLPVFMSGLVFHRLSDSWQNSLGNDLAEVIDPTLASRSGQVDGNEDNMEKQKRPGKGTRTRPPVAYASCAPFPFLPAPTYTMS